jgi:putative glutamine transport system substrate-binding protein
MKHVALILLFCFYAVTSFSQGKAGESWKAVKQKGTGTLYLLYSEFPSFCFKTKTNEYEGIDVEIMNDFVQYAKKNYAVTLKPEFIEMPDGSSDYLYLKNSSGGVVCIVDFVRTQQRLQEVDFSTTFDYTYDLLITHDNLPNLTAIANINKEFAGLTGYAVKGTIQEKRLTDLKNKNYPDLKITTVKDYTLLKDAIVKDPKGMAFLDSYIYLELLRKHAPIKHHPIATLLSDESAFIWPKGSDWLQVFNSFLAANGGYRNSNRYRELLIKYFGESGLKLLRIGSEKSKK